MPNDQSDSTLMRLSPLNVEDHPLIPGTSLFWYQEQWYDRADPDDRAAQFGDALFETMRTAHDGSLPLWHWHRVRLQEGFERLKFPPSALSDVEMTLRQLNLGANRSGSVGLKLLVSRGSSRQGYGTSSCQRVNIRWTVFSLPEWRIRQQPQGLVVGVNPIRVSRQPLLAGLKHANRLEQVLAREAFEPHWDESIVLDDQQQVIEATMSNVIWLEQDKALTPPVDQAGVNGVVRRWLMEQGVLEEADCDITRLTLADGVLLSNAIMGLVPVSQLEQTRYDRDNPRTCHFMTHQILLEAMF